MDLEEATKPFTSFLGILLVLPLLKSGLAGRPTNPIADPLGFPFGIFIESGSPPVSQSRDLRVRIPDQCMKLMKQKIVILYHHDY